MFSCVNQAKAFEWERRRKQKQEEEEEYRRVISKYPMWINYYYRKYELISRMNKFVESVPFAFYFESHPAIAQAIQWNMNKLPPINIEHSNASIGLLNFLGTSLLATRVLQSTRTHTPRLETSDNLTMSLYRFQRQLPRHTHKHHNLNTHSPCQTQWNDLWCQNLNMNALKCNWRFIFHVQYSWRCCMIVLLTIDMNSFNQIEINSAPSHTLTQTHIRINWAKRHQRICANKRMMMIAEQMSKNHRLAARRWINWNTEYVMLNWNKLCTSHRVRMAQPHNRECVNTSTTFVSFIVVPARAITLVGILKKINKRNFTDASNGNFR